MISRVTHYFFTLYVLGSLTVTAGCVTGPPRQVRENLQQREDYLILQEDIRRLSGRLEGIELEVQRLGNQINDLKNQSSQAADVRQIEELERKFSELEQVREQDKQEIVDRLSKQMAKLMKKAPVTTRPASSEFGYEHEVQPGETLSVIAKAYGVSVRAIVGANEILNPDNLRVGQKIFIPE